MSDSQALDIDLPPYDTDEFHNDLHHLIQPIIGEMRLVYAERFVPAEPNASLAHQIERLSLVLGLADHHRGLVNDRTAEVRRRRTRHGCGHFQQESQPMRERLQAWHDAQQQQDGPS